MIPDWLHWLAVASLAAGFACALVIVLDELRKPQHMTIMNVVWPVTALFASVAALAAYYVYGRPRERETPFPVVVGKGTTHCGAGCCLGDIAAEWLAFAFPAVAVWLGWQSLFADKMFAVWLLDYIFAFALGIVFQYFSIVPMRGLSLGDGLLQAAKADALSLTAWQVGMYGFMALAKFVIFAGILAAPLEVDRPAFWLMMQIAMLAGFAASYPVNWWLIRSGVKEAM